jgi:hypothetical protein
MAVNSELNDSKLAVNSQFTAVFASKGKGKGKGKDKEEQTNVDFAPTDAVAACVPAAAPGGGSPEVAPAAAAVPPVAATTAVAAPQAPPPQPAASAAPAPEGSKRPRASAERLAAVDRLWAHYRSHFPDGSKGTRKLTPKLEGMVLARLRDWPEEELRAVITYVATDPWRVRKGRTGLEYAVRSHEQTQTEYSAATAPRDNGSEKLEQVIVAQPASRQVYVSSRSSDGGQIN